MNPSPNGRWVESRFLIALGSIKSTMFIQWVTVRFQGTHPKHTLLYRLLSIKPIQHRKPWEDMFPSWYESFQVLSSDAGQLAAFFRTARHWSMQMLETARRSNAVHAVIQSSSDFLRKKTLQRQQSRVGEAVKQS